MQFKYVLPSHLFNFAYLSHDRFQIIKQMLDKDSLSKYKLHSLKYDLIC